MSWLEKLNETYEHCSSAIGVIEKRKVKNKEIELTPLLPVSHTMQNAHIEITINEDGEFLSAKVVDKSNAPTLIPCTESSSGRTSGQCPHPLHDKLEYVAKDYEEKTNSKSDFKNYLDQLEKWTNFSNDKSLQAVFKYVDSGSLIDDCVSDKILFLGDGDKLLKTWDDKSNAAPAIFKLLPGGADGKGKDKPNQRNAFVRFCVETKESLSSSLQSSPALWQSWSDFCKNQEVRIDVCYSTGVETAVAKQHPSKIRNSGDKAKLISDNDNSGFTFRGKFSSGEQACSIAFDVTQKAHNALRWLISRQGRKFGDQTIVTWATLGDLPPDPCKSSYDLFISPSDVIDEDDDKPENDESKKNKIGKEKKPLVVYTAQDFAEKMNSMMSGYSKKFTNDDTNLIMIMAIDSATTGRMAVRYYRELRGADFLERVREWHESCSWYQYFGFYKQFVGAPAPKDIAEAAYGKKLDSKNKLLNATVSRLIPCIIDATPIPSDLVDSCVRRACQRISMDYWEWNKTLGIACALYRKQQQNKNYTMEYEENRNTRDYLYGSLLAIADHIEERALHMASEKRDTNAAKLMQRFAERPFSTWRTLYLQLTPYLSRLKNKNSSLHLRLNKQLDDLYSRIQIADFIQDAPLSGEFLLGFHTLRKKLWENTTDKNEPDISQNEQES